MQINGHEKIKVGFLISHPIQYHAPLFRELSQSEVFNLTVLYCWNFGVTQPEYDMDFCTNIQWDTPLLTGYSFLFLRNFSPRPHNSFFGQINLEIIPQIWCGNYDALVVYGWNSFTNWIAVFTAWVCRVPIFLRGDSSSLIPPRNLFTRFLKKPLLSFLFNHVKFFLTIGIRNREFYRIFGVPEKKFIQSPLCVDNFYFMSENKKLLPKRHELRTEFGIPENAVCFLFAGKLIEHKGCRNLLNAFIKLISHDQSFLLFVGDGPLQKELSSEIRMLIPANADITGFINQSEMPRYYTAADVCVLPSLFEPWGLVVNEAMCSRLPIIASDAVGAAPDLIKDGWNGFTYPADNVEALSRILFFCLQHKSELPRFGARSFERIQSFSYRHNRKSIEEALVITASPNAN